MSEKQRERLRERYWAWLGMLKVPRITSLQYLSSIWDKFDFLFLHQDKDQNFVQVCSIIFGGHCQAWPKYQKY